VLLDLQLEAHDLGVALLEDLVLVGERPLIS
jgi:hypothetical protein